MIMAWEDGYILRDAVNCWKCSGSSSMHLFTCRDQALDLLGALEDDLVSLSQWMSFSPEEVS